MHITTFKIYNQVSIRDRNQVDCEYRSQFNMKMKMRRKVAMQQKAVEDKIIRIECKKMERNYESKDKTLIALVNRAVYSVHKSIGVANCMRAFNKSLTCCRPSSFTSLI